MGSRRARAMRMSRRAHSYSLRDYIRNYIDECAASEPRMAFIADIVKTPAREMPSLCENASGDNKVSMHCEREDYRERVAITRAGKENGKFILRLVVGRRVIL